MLDNGEAYPDCQSQVVVIKNTRSTPADSLKAKIPHIPGSR